jgi:hypothetical protein
VQPPFSKVLFLSFIEMSACDECLELGDVDEFQLILFALTSDHEPSLEVDLTLQPSGRRRRLLFIDERHSGATTAGQPSRGVAFDVSASPE